VVARTVSSNVAVLVEAVEFGAVRHVNSPVVVVVVDVIQRGYLGVETVRA
jgi:hypothetical protein